MALPAARFDAESSVEEHTDRLEKQVERLHADVAEVKADVRRIDAKVDGVKDSVTTLQGEVKDGFLALVDRIAESERGIRSDFKSDHDQLRSELKSEFGQLRGEMGQLRGEMAQARHEFKAEMGQLRSDFKAEMALLRSDSRADSAQLRGEVSELRRDHKTLLRAGISASVFVLTVFAGGYYRLDEKVSALQVAVARIAQAREMPDSPEAAAERKPDPPADQSRPRL